MSGVISITGVVMSVWKNILHRGIPCFYGQLLLYFSSKIYIYDHLDDSQCLSLFGTSDVHGSAATKGNIPLQDQHLVLAILLELAVQRGTLR